MDEVVPTSSRLKKPLSDFRQIESRVAWVLCLGVVVGTLIRGLGRWHWLCEITTHFVVQATCLAAGTTLLLLMRRHWRPAVLTACLSLVNAAEWVPYYFNTPDTKTRNAGESLVVVSANVYSRNRDSNSLHQWLHEIQADVVFISEVDPWWANQIESWKVDWPHQVIRPRSDNFGLAIISRMPIFRSNVIFLEGDIPAVDCQIQSPQGMWTIVGLHPLPPAGARNSDLRNQQLQTAAERIRELPSPRIVLGDLNSSSSSPFFRDFLTTTGLRDSREGFGWQPTWPSGSRLLRIPIDHCLVEPEVQVVNRTIGPDIGSDHLPVQCQLFRSP